MKLPKQFALLASVALSASSVSAIPISVSGTVGGETVNASGTLTAEAGQVNVELINNQADPNSVKQLISGISFDVSGASGSGALTTVNSGKTIDIVSGGHFSTVDLSDPLTRWEATETGTSIHLTTLSGGPPDHLIIGPENSGSGLYEDANASILGDNPSVYLKGTFQITVPGVTENSRFENVVFYFNTSGDSVDVPGVPDGGTTVALLGLGLTGLGLIRRKVAAA